MAGAYYTGKDGSVAIGNSPGTPLKILKFEYRDKAEVVRSRAGGDGAISRKGIAVDWELSVEAIFGEDDTPLDITSLRLQTVGWVAKTDDTPKLLGAGSGLVTEASYGSPVDNNVTISLKIECNDPDADNLPTWTPDD